jgi:hypothetical protein
MRHATHTLRSRSRFSLLASRFFFFWLRAPGSGSWQQQQLLGFGFWLLASGMCMCTHALRTTHYYTYTAWAQVVFCLLGTPCSLGTEHRRSGCPPPAARSAQARRRRPSQQPAAPASGLLRSSVP